MKAMERIGIAVAGTVIVDKINEISAYPAAGELTQIRSIQNAIGGCVPNVAIDLKKIAPELPICAIGCIGDDPEGAFVQETLADAGLDISGLGVRAGEKTSFTDVMSIPGGQRTFFTYPGASANFGVADVDFDKLNAKILHLGYFLLLQKVDDGDGLEILKEASARGIVTSIDLVSENSDRYGLVLPCLPYTDHLIINELEAGKLTGMEPVNSNLEAIARKLKSMGVRGKVIIHKPDCSVCCSEDGFTAAGSCVLPQGYIQGTTGAGDAFCAGALIGIYNGWTDLEIMDFAAQCAAMALGSADATSGMCSQEKIREFCKDFPRRAAAL
jgi:sugar/nucleoside kinase (ribokinase family)